ncbi:hypothetical protein HDU96_003449, partial [Phlyctochytrium bullatum]
DSTECRHLELPLQLDGQDPTVGGLTELYRSKTDVSAGNLPTKKLFGFTRREKASPGYYIPNPGAPSAAAVGRPQVRPDIRNVGLANHHDGQPKDVWEAPCGCGAGCKGGDEGRERDGVVAG